MHQCTKNIIRKAYSTSNPNPLSTDAPQADEMLALSAFLQHPTWPLCTQVNHCQKPTIVHRPDVCIVFQEQNQFVPQGGQNFRVPILICEVEGSKDTWGEGEKESKAIEEACYALAFIPENYILFVYARRCELFVCKRNPYTGSIDIEKQIVYVQREGDTFKEKWSEICTTITKILVKQLTTRKQLIELTLPRLRQNGVDGIDIFHPHKNVCRTCWSIQTIAFAPAMLGANPNEIPQFE